MSLSDRIKEILGELGVSFKEKSRSIHTACPRCGQSDKFSVLKENGACICYRGSCDFGKSWFQNWIAETTGLSIKEAKKMLYQEMSSKRREELGTAYENSSGIWTKALAAADVDNTSDLPQISPIQYPEWHMIKLSSPEAVDAVKYLERRGITLDLANKHNIMFSPSHRRVIFPITMSDRVYGWQGRAIDPVEPLYRMRNNTGFRREHLVMFYDNLKNCDYAIIAEGPIDALKFSYLGGFVATMGKIVTDHQLQRILSSGVKKIYLALDDDAAPEIRDLFAKIPIPVYHVIVPSSRRVACEATGKKADFGECTFEECAEAVRDAKQLTYDNLPYYFKTKEDS